MHVCVIAFTGGDNYAKDKRYYIKSMPGAWIGSIDIAKAKAYTALAFSSNENAMTSRALGILSKGPLWGIGHTNAEEGGIVTFPGGIPLYKNGILVGAIGVSGDGADQDEIVALAGCVNFEAPWYIKTDHVMGVVYVKK